MTHPAPNFLPGRRDFLCGVGAACVASTAFAAGMDRFEKAKAPKAVPDFEFRDAEDKASKLSDLQGKVVLVNFWATWCAPCVKEMPSLNTLQGKVGKDKLVVLPLSLDGPSKPKVAPFYADKKLGNLGIWFDPGRKAMQALGVSILPTSILVDARGREIGRLEGEAEWDTQAAIALVSAAIAS
jgi:thiol-disulfide isomerase/thioredoxin